MGSACLALSALRGFEGPGPPTAALPPLLVSESPGRIRMRRVSFEVPATSLPSP